MKNTDLYRSEKDADFDIQEEEAKHFSKGYKHLAGILKTLNFSPPKKNY